MKRRIKVTAAFDRTIRLLAFLAIVLIIFFTLAVAVGVFTRYFLKRPLEWVTELSEYSLLYITFLGAAWVLEREGHVSVDAVLNRVKPRTQLLINMITSIVCVAICLIFVWYGSRATWEQFVLGRYKPTLLNIPLAYISVIIPVGYFLLLIQFLRRTYGYLGRWRSEAK